MKVMQFAYYGWDSIHLPYKYTENYVAYTGTHDNDTMLGWLWSLSRRSAANCLLIVALRAIGAPVGRRAPCCARFLKRFGKRPHA